MKLNWKHLCFDIFTLAYLGLSVLSWETQPKEKQVMRLVIVSILVIYRVYDHYEFYKKERRFY